MTAGGGIFLDGSNSVTINAPLTANGVLPPLVDPASYVATFGNALSPQPLAGQSPGIAVETPSLVVNNALTSSHGTILTDASSISGNGSLSASNFVSIGNANSVTLGVPVTADGLSINAPTVTLNSNVNVAVADIQAATSVSGSGSLNIVGNNTSLDPFFGSCPTCLILPVGANVFVASPSIATTGLWSFTNVTAILPGAVSNLAGPLSLTNSKIYVGLQWPGSTLQGTTSPSSFTLSGGLTIDNKSFIGCYSLKASTCGTSAGATSLSLNSDIAGGTFLATNIQLGGTSIGNAAFRADGDIGLTAPSMTFGPGVTITAGNNLNIASSTLTFPQGSSTDLTASSILFQHQTSASIVGTPTLIASNLISSPVPITITNSSNLPSGGIFATLQASQINPDIQVGSNSGVVVLATNDPNSGNRQNLGNNYDIGSNASIFLLANTISGNITAGSNSVVNLSGVNLAINGSVALGSNTSLFANGSTLAFNGTLTAAQNTSGNPTTIGLASSGDLILNGKIDVSRLSLGTQNNQTPNAVYFVAGGSVVNGTLPFAELNGPSGNILAGSHATIIGGDGPLRFLAGNAIGSANFPVPIVAIPFAEATTFNFRACALGQFACGTGGTLVSGLGLNSSPPTGGVLFNLNSSSTLPMGFGPTPTPLTPNSGETFSPAANPQWFQGSFQKPSVSFENNATLISLGSLKFDIYRSEEVETYQPAGGTLYVVRSRGLEVGAIDLSTSISLGKGVSVNFDVDLSLLSATFERAFVFGNYLVTITSNSNIGMGAKAVSVELIGWVYYGAIETTRWIIQHRHQEASKLKTLLWLAVFGLTIASEPSFAADKVVGWPNVPPEIVVNASIPDDWQTAGVVPPGRFDSGAGNPPVMAFGEFNNADKSIFVELRYLPRKPGEEQKPFLQEFVTTLYGCKLFYEKTLKQGEGKVAYLLTYDSASHSSSKYELIVEGENYTVDVLAHVDVKKFTDTDALNILKRVHILIKEPDLPISGIQPALAGGATA